MNLVFLVLTRIYTYIDRFIIVMYKSSNSIASLGTTIINIISCNTGSKLYRLLLKIMFAGQYSLALKSSGNFSNLNFIYERSAW